MNHPSVAPLAKDKKKVGRTKESARKQERPPSQGGFFLSAYRGYLFRYLERVPDIGHGHSSFSSLWTAA